jgi:hypothetical protein
MMGGGHPGKIVKMACETDKSSVVAMVDRGRKAIGSRTPVVSAASAPAVAASINAPSAASFAPPSGQQQRLSHLATPADP